MRPCGVSSIVVRAVISWSPYSRTMNRYGALVSVTGVATWVDGARVAATGAAGSGRPRCTPSLRGASGRRGAPGVADSVGVAAGALAVRSASAGDRPGTSAGSAETTGTLPG